MDLTQTLCCVQLFKHTFAISTKPLQVVTTQMDFRKSTKNLNLLMFKDLGLLQEHPKRRLAQKLADRSIKEQKSDRTRIKS